MSSEIDNKLQKLKDVFDAGVLTAEEYDRKVNEVMREGVAPAEESEVKTDNIAKETAQVEPEDDGVVYFNENDKAQTAGGGGQDVFTYQNPKGSVGKPKKKGKKKWIIIGGIVLVLILFGAIGSCDVEETYDWPTSGLAKMLPEPDGDVTDVYNDQDEVDATVEISDEDYFNEYIDQCKEMGFDITKDAGNPRYLDKAYTAFNKEGYKLDLGYDDYDKPELEIYLYRPIQSKDISWPSSGIGSSLPKPESMKGEIVDESEDYFQVYVADTSLSDYEAYVDAVMGAGYKKEYDKYDYKFDAYYKDTEDIYVNVEYYGNQFMYINIEDYRDDSDKEDVSDDEEVSSDFKKTMDDYEAFMDDYIEFMKKYNDSDDVSSMLSDYADMMTQYGEFAEKIDAIDEDSLSDSDYDYYIEVTTRVADKLAKASL